MGSDVAKTGSTRNAQRILMGKCLKKCLLGRRRRIWKNKFRMNLRDIDCDNGRWMEHIRAEISHSATRMFEMKI
jgi:hypothetical protein